MLNNSLLEMSLEQLWELFPIILVSPDENWPFLFGKERQLLSEILKEPEPVRIEHIGSTAIRGIWAKPIVDILIEFRSPDDLLTARQVLELHGYLCMSESDRRISMNKGYTEKGYASEVYHLHLRCPGDHDEIQFRDYLNEHPEIAVEYEKLKLSLWKEFEHDRDGYTAAKSDFVGQVMKLART